MKYSLSFLLAVILIVALLFGWLRSSQVESSVNDVVLGGDAATVTRWVNRRPKLLSDNQFYPRSMLLRSAVESGSVETVAAAAPVLLKNARSQDMYNALSLAIRNKDIKSAKVLLENGLDPNANKDFCALVQAHDQGLTEFVDLLLEHNADPSLALAWACKQSEPSFALRLLSLGADVKTPGALTAAVRSGNLDLIQSLLAQKPPTATGLIGISNQTPRNIVDRLVKKAKFEALDAQQTRDLLKAIYRYDDLDTFQTIYPKLKQFPASVDPISTMVNAASEVSEPLDKLDIVIKHALDSRIRLIDRITGHSTSAHSVLRRLAGEKLFQAEDQANVFKRLLAAVRKEDPNFKFPAYQNPIADCFDRHWEPSKAVPRQVQLQIAKHLIELGLWQRVSEVEGYNALHDMAHSRFDETNERIAKLLLEQGIDINAMATYASTPLHRCISDGNLAMAKFLLENGANANAKGELDETPLDIVRHLSNLPKQLSSPTKLPELRTLLLAHSAVHGLKEDFPLTVQEQRQLNFALRAAAQPQAALKAPMNGDAEQESSQTE